MGLDCETEGQLKSSAYCNPSSTMILVMWLFAAGILTSGELLFRLVFG